MSNPAVTYEREMVPSLFGPWVKDLLDAARLRAPERTLDLACGTGIVARGVAAQVGSATEVSGIDLNPAMIEVARSESARAGLQIDWREGRAEALPYGDRSFDLVLCQQGLQFFSDKAAALVEAHRVLDSNGRFVVSVWRGLDRHPFFATMNAVIERRFGMAPLAAPFALGDAEELRALLSAAGFVDIDIQARSKSAHFPDPNGFVRMEVDVIAAAVPSVQHMDEAERAELAAGIGSEMDGPIRASTQAGHLVVPMFAHIASARRGTR